ncbi:MAG: 3-phosphoserine/phosphohydroxythreonine transaminase [Peptoniphilus sp.]|nr:3-phosphoserine/phosphohydroxythreonine transaminase [Peptoniphilus sp.]MDD7363293.1 3-phosphoserine/phosphohydroxythreonine transaminase [Bacillota bacterium]MDY6045388.1 3-phosphoserine/phosphohydroxythreonine transaminase [Peptoniphilus sp.]
MERVLNFSAGPSTLPVEVLEKASDDMVNYRGSGMSVMEMSHRSAEYEAIQEDAKASLRSLLSLDDDHDVLFLQGGASLQFTMIPMNLLSKDDSASYVISGSWAKKAHKEAALLRPVEILASSEDDGFSYFPKISVDEMAKDSKYLYVCANNTIYGTRLSPERMNALDTTVVADMSSNILSEVYDVNKLGLAFAGAQKNLGPSGVTVVILKKDLLVNEKGTLPTMLDYRTHIEKDSKFNTPPCYSIYICGLVLDWVKRMGGVEAMEARNKEKAKLLYDTIDNSGLYKNVIPEEDRSLTNVVFVTGSKELDAEFVKGAKEKGIVNIKGHRSVGGMRASIYNAMDIEGVEALVDYMKEFERNNG